MLYFGFSMFTGQVRLLILYLTGHVMSCPWFCICIGQVMSYFIRYVDWSGQVILHSVCWLIRSGYVMLHSVCWLIRSGHAAYSACWLVRSGNFMHLILYCNWSGQVILCQVRSCFWFCILQTKSVILQIMHIDRSCLSYFWFCILIDQVCHISDSLFWLIRSIIFLILHFDWSGVSYFWFYVLTDQVCHTSIFWLMRSLSH